ncbi:hypothetical protein TNCV_3720901 [Trichonephila clavipes]|nr:hypothetical protein TNCV_3720901 [Trichonephila clavipes]
MQDQWGGRGQTRRAEPTNGMGVGIDDHVHKAPIIAEKDILEIVQSSKIVIDTDVDDKKEMNNAALVLTSSIIV